MYETSITVKNKVISIRFGAYVIKLLADDGIKLTDLAEALQDNAADVIPKIIYFGAINASEGRKGEGISINDIYDWLDEVEGGLFGPQASAILELFTKQMTDSVPKNVPAGEKKKTPQKTKR